MAVERISPVDGRYSDTTEPLSDCFSEMALQRKRLEVEVEYLLALSEVKEIPLAFDETEQEELRESYRTFDEEDMATVKRLEVRSGHDVKAVMDYLQERLEKGEEYVHFGLTSEDTTNLALTLLVKEALEEVLFPAFVGLNETLRDRVEEWKDVPMLGFTHGQPASPTTLGKELAVFLKRAGTASRDVAAATQDLGGKLAGATGNFSAHHVAFPDVDWQQFAREFVESFDLQVQEPVTQIKHQDDFARLFHALIRMNNVLLDCSRDMWQYFSKQYVYRGMERDETNSSTMPHKINPKDFENAEGNLSKANSDLAFLASYLPVSRMQRDLSGSTVRRNIGVALAHTLIGWKRCRNGLVKLLLDEERMRKDLQENGQVLAEPLQTLGRVAGHEDAPDIVKDSLGDRALKDIAAKLELPDDLEERFKQLTSEEYLGRAEELDDRALEENRRYMRTFEGE